MEDFNDLQKGTYAKKIPSSVNRTRDLPVIGESYSRTLYLLSHRGWIKKLAKN